MTFIAAAPWLRPGRLAAGSRIMPTSRPRMAAIYAPGTVRARRWRGDGDVRGYRPPLGWSARADPTDIPPSRATHCRVPCGGSSRRRSDTRTGPSVSRWGRWIQKSGRGGGHAQRRIRTALTPRRRPRSCSGGGFEDIAVVRDAGMCRSGQSAISAMPHFPA